MNRRLPISESQNRASAIALRVIDALLIRNPERTAIGVALGIAIDGILAVLQPALARKGVQLGHMEWWASICVGLVVVHLPFIAWSIRHKPLISDELESLIKLVESTNIGELEKRVAYRRVVNKCIEQFSLVARPGAIKDTVAAEVEGVHDNNRK